MKKSPTKHRKSPESPYKASVNIAEGLTGSILESISDGVFTVDLNWNITSFNRAAEQITGVKRRDAIGRKCSDVFRSSMCQVGCSLKTTLKTLKPVINRSCFILRSDGRQIPISVSTAVLYDPNGEIIGGAETFRDLSELEALRKELSGRVRIGDLISRSPTMRKVFDLIPALASNYSTVLIQGETGTGKELVAKAVHGSGTFSGKPFMAVNCAALPETLLESELFGYHQGAFTGAVRDKPGLMQVAGDGTLFLDEIGDISPAIQAKLLRAFQEKTFQPLGGTTPQRLRARIITATNRDLAVMVKEGAFREDLYYRLNVIRIDLPPLRQRKEDIPMLVESFIEKFNLLYNRQIKAVNQQALTMLMAHDWPGNIRELENLVERAIILCPTRVIGSDFLLIDDNSVPPDEKPGIRSARALAEAASIKTALARNNFNISRTAEELEVHRATLYRKIAQHRLQSFIDSGKSN